MIQFIIVVAFISMRTAGEDFEIENLFYLELIGFGLMIASFLWARRPFDKKIKKNRLVIGLTKKGGSQRL